MKDIIFWGASGQAKVLYEATIGSDVNLVALVDNRLLSSPIPNVPILKGMEGLQRWLLKRGKISDLYYTVAVGGGHGQDRIDLMRNLEKNGLNPLTIVHPKAFVARDAIVGPACQILAQSAVCSQSRLGKSVIVNTAASVDHESIIGNCVHIAPGARLAGETIVGDGAFIGMGALVLPRIRIGAFATVGSGAIVTRNVPSGVTVVGSPAKIIEV